MEVKKQSDEEVATQVVDVAFQVYIQLGPGLYESAYEAVIGYELEKRGLRVHRQVPIPLVWDGMMLHECYRVDLLVEDLVLVELKSVEILPPVAVNQIQTYLRLSERRLGFLLNFGVARLDKCINRFVNNKGAERNTPPPPFPAFSRS